MSACRSDRRTSVVRSPNSCRQGRPRLIMRVASRISFSLKPRVGGCRQIITISRYTYFVSTFRFCSRSPRVTDRYQVSAAGRRIFRPNSVSHVWMLHLRAVTMLCATPSEAPGGDYQNKHPQQRLPLTGMTNMPLPVPEMGCGGLAHL